MPVGSDGSLDPTTGGSSQVVFRVVQPEQSMAYNNGGCVVSTLITINEPGQFDTQCAVLCHFAKVQGTAPDGSSTQPLTLVAMSGGVAWASLLGGPTEAASSWSPPGCVKPCKSNLNCPYYPEQVCLNGCCVF